MLPTQLAYVVAEVIEESRRCVREIRTCGNMIRLFETILEGQGTAPMTPEPSDDPLDRMIESLCGHRSSAGQPSLKEVLDKDITLYRLRIVKSRQKIQKLVFGRTPEDRLQTLLDRVSEHTRTANGANVDNVLLLHRLIKTVEDMKATLPDLFGKQFRIEDAIAVRRVVCLRLSKEPESLNQLEQKVASSTYHEDHELMACVTEK